jgi:AraC family transcriptional regulator of adaptative response / DNA-3-methyladenine glycosylase II
MSGGPHKHSRNAAAARKDTLSVEILDSIQAGKLNDKGVRGLADSLHISERHLRRLVQAKTGTSPLHLNDTNRLDTAKRLVIETALPIIDIAFMSDFSSLRQFNDVFKEAFKTSPSEMRKTVGSTDTVSLTNTDK